MLEHKLRKRIEKEKEKLSKLALNDHENSSFSGHKIVAKSRQIDRLINWYHRLSRH